MRGQGVVGMVLAVMVFGRMACAWLPMPELVTGQVEASTSPQKDVAAMRASGSPVRVGTFDSRAVATAYYRSEPFKRQIKELRTRYEKAKAAGDEKLVKKLGAEGPAIQELAHKQGFGTWSVDNILKKISKKLPAMARQANVDVIVSKWDVAYQRSGVEFVDVTDLMVTPFAPDEKTRKVIQEIQKQKPVPLAELENHHDD